MDKWWDNKMKWDTRFLNMADLVGSWSKDPSTKVGAVITDSHNRVISVGYNGFARGIIDTPERYANRDLKYKMVVHAERNAMLFANTNLFGCTLYTTPLPPCSSCAAMIIQSGIQRIVSYDNDIENPRWKDDFVIAQDMYKEACINIQFYTKEANE